MHVLTNKLHAALYHVYEWIRGIVQKNASMELIKDALTNTAYEYGLAPTCDYLIL